MDPPSLPPLRPRPGAPSPPSAPLGAVLVAVGGALGSAARYELQLLAPASGRDLPWTILAVNVSGAAVLGLLVGVLAGPRIPARSVRVGRPLLATGFIGAYTTWSTYLVGAAVLVRDHRAGVAFAYVAVTLLAGLAVAAAGMAAGASRAGRR